VEDEEALGMALGDRLRSEGYEVDVANDGITAFEMATSRSFDLMILDIMLPGRNGLDLCRDIRQTGLGTPILLLSARDSAADKVVGLELGADDYVTKPFDLRELVTRIQALLRRGTGQSGSHVYVSGPIRMDFSAMQVNRERDPVHSSAGGVAMNQNILLVEDEEALGMALGDRLRSEGYEVDVANDGITAFEMATSRSFDLMILDIMLPGRNGLDLCRDIRQTGLGTPILLLSAKDSTADKVVGLKLGADDYVTKPFDLRELVTRIQTLLRRGSGSSGSNLYVIGPIRIDFSTMEASRAGEPVHLSAMEFRLMRYLLRHPGVGLSRETILREVWGRHDTTTTRTVDVHVAALRQKLESDPTQPELIVTVKGFGYMFTGEQRTN
jgi:two-component system alkaline phosphatase synthesis response regulator PhoP